MATPRFGDVVAAMHELAVRDAVGSLTEADLEAMREANTRFRSAIELGDMEAALRADDELRGVPVAVAANQALTAVLEQFTPVLRRAERLRFSSLDGRASVARHDDGPVRLPHPLDDDSQVVDVALWLMGNVRVFDLYARLRPQTIPEVTLVCRKKGPAC